MMQQTLTQMKNCELQEYQDKLTKSINVSTQKEQLEKEQVSELAYKMQSFMAEQSAKQQKFVEQQYLRQQDFMERQMVNQHELMDELTAPVAPKDPSTSTKLPKLELRSFHGDKLKWQEFWDSFECAVHKNSKLSDTEKFNYLQSKLSGEAKTAIAGLSLCHENYIIAVDLLKERYGKKQEIIDLHYYKMMNIAPPTNKTEHLGQFLDTTEKHLRSLAVMGENPDQTMFVSMIKSKLPRDVLLHLEVQKGTGHEWTVKELRERLRAYITAREHSEQDAKRQSHKTTDLKQISQHGLRPETKYMTQTRKPEHKHMLGRQHISAETLVSGDSPTSNYANKCRYCADRHWSDECTKFKTIPERKKILKDSCYKCLKVGHKTTECRQSKLCVHCGEKDVHHRSLCPKKYNVKIQSHRNESVNVSEEVENQNSDFEENRENVLVSSGEVVLMQTALAEAKNPTSGKNKQVRLLFDSGSQRTYVTEHLAEQLNLVKGEAQEIKLLTFGSNKAKVIKTPSTKLKLKLNNGSYLTITANIVPDITGTIERKAVKIPKPDEIQHLLKSVDMADTIPTEIEYYSIDLLIGNDNYLDVVLPQRIEVQPGLYLLSSKLGWILTGRTNETDRDINDTNMLILSYGSGIAESSAYTSVDSVVSVKPDLEDFWKLESIGVTDDPTSSDDGIAMEKFRETLKFADGRYQATWPWKKDNPDLPVNFGLAMGRLKSTVARMSDKPELMKQYNSVIQDQLCKGVIEKVNGDSGGVKHYLPHHAVITPQKTTTKLRLVYDASAKTSSENKSLNECLYRGPVMLHDLCGILMRFRTHNIAVVADIEKAFLQVGLQPDQRDATRFLWLKDCENLTTDRENIQEYRFCRVPFGMISSPFILGATIECHLESYQSDAAEKLKNDIYVDNVITGTGTEAEAINLYKTSKTMFEEAAMNLREWSTNSHQKKIEQNR